LPSSCFDHPADHQLPELSKIELQLTDILAIELIKGLISGLTSLTSGLISSFTFDLTSGFVGEDEDHF
jgi:hypothetical protein